MTSRWFLTGIAASPVHRDLAIHFAVIADSAWRYVLVAVGSLLLGVLTDLGGKLKGAVDSRIVGLAGAVVNPIGRQHRNQVLRIVRSPDDDRFQQAESRVPDLDEVFCQVRLAADADDIPPGLLAKTPLGNASRFSLDALLDKREGTVLAVLGGPGSGKSALLDHTAQQVCRASRRRRGVAIPLRAADIARFLDSGRRIQLPQLISQVFAGDDQRLSNWFASRLEHGDCVILIDALDEVTDIGRRDNLARWIGRQSGKYQANDYVIASRPREFQETGVWGARRLGICGLDGDQTYAFLYSWSEAVTGRGRRRLKKKAAEAQDTADDLLERIKRSSALNELAANPLVLSLMAAAGQTETGVPQWRVRVYRDVVGELLGRCPPATDGGRVLGAIAFTMLLQQRDRLAQAELTEAISKELGQTVDAAEALASVAATGLLIQDGGFYSIAHRAFGAYLAAAQIRARCEAGLLAGHLDDARWREVTLLYASGAVLPGPGRVSPPGPDEIDPIVAACLESQTMTALALAQDCREQGGKLSAELRRQLDGWFNPAEILESEPAKQEKMARVALTRLLDAAIPAEAGGKVCTGLFPRWLHAVLTQDEGDAAAAKHTSPDAPLRGARDADARNAVEWANMLLGRQACRLPTPAEIRDPHVQRALAAAGGGTLPLWVWSLEPRAAGPELIQVSGEDPYLVTGEDLARHIAADLAESAAVSRALLALRSVAAVTAITGGLAHHGPAEKIRGENLDLIHDLLRTLSLLLALLQVDITPASGERTKNAIDDARRLRSAVRASSAAQAGGAQPKAGPTLSRLDGHLRQLAQDLLPGDSAAWRALGLSRALPVRPGSGPGLVPEPPPPAEVFGESLTQVMAPSLALALSTVLRRGTSARDWNTDFAHALCGQAALSPASRLSVPPGNLRGQVDRAIVRAAEPAYGGESRTAQSLIRHVLAGDGVKDAITGRLPVTSQTASTVRLSAMWAAAEATRIGNDELAIFLCEVAACITVLKHRTGRQNLPEAIALAVA